MIYRHPSPYNLNHREYLQLGEVYREDPYLFDSVSYAERYEITSEIAVERFEILQALIGLDSGLKNTESETYGGLYIRHSPGFCIVTLFTVDGKDIIKSNVPDNLREYIEVQPVAVSYAGLERDQAEIKDTLNKMGVDSDSYIDIPENRIVFNVIDMSPIDATVEEGELEIPDYVDVIKVGKLGRRQNTSTD
jgi:hypothetical protein